MWFQRKRYVKLSEVDVLCENLAAMMVGFKPDFVVSIETGGWYAGKYLARHFSIPHRTITIRRQIDLQLLYRCFPKALRFIPALWHGVLFLMATPVMTQGLAAGAEQELAGKKILIVDDVTQSGKTLTVAESYLQSLAVKSTKIAVLSTVWGRATDYRCLSGIHYFPWSRSSAEYAHFEQLRLAP
jgi:hypoxanthine phosphoribosyltransferase